MESLALLVSLIFLAVILLGPTSLLLHRIGFRTLGCCFAMIAVLVGGYWACVAPLPVSLLGGISVVFGMLTISKY